MTETNGDTIPIENPLDNGSLDISSIDSNTIEIDLEDILTLESKNKELLRLLKTDLEEKILSRIKHSFNESQSNQPKKYQIHFNRDFITDKIGSSVRIAETSICEGWNVPKYENEYQNLLGLPSTEDDPVDRIKLKKPTQECFNCLATNHKITECPIKHDQERIQMHRKNFASQSLAAQEQAQLFSNRYTSDDLDKGNRGFTPGKISDNLREALGLNKRQLPPFVYIMRELGYPIGWLKEAQVRKSGLNVVDGKKLSTGGDDDDDVTVLESVEEGEEIESENPEYNPEKILDFEGFNQPVPEGFIDEYREFGVMRYNDHLSKKRFLSKLRLTDKTKPKSRSVHNLKKLDSTTSVQQETTEEDKPNADEEATTTTTTDTQNVSFTLVDQEEKSIQIEETGAAVTETTAGTPIVINLSGIDKVPGADKFSIDIGDFKPYEMLSNSTGNYMKIVKLTRELNNKE